MRATVITLRSPPPHVAGDPFLAFCVVLVASFSFHVLHRFPRFARSSFCHFHVFTHFSFALCVAPLVLIVVSRSAFFVIFIFLFYLFCFLDLPLLLCTSQNIFRSASLHSRLHFLSSAAIVLRLVTLFFSSSPRRHRLFSGGDHCVFVFILGNHIAF